MQRLTFAAVRLSCVLRYPPDIEQYALVGIDMTHTLQWTCGTQCDAQLLVQLARQCFGHCLAGMNLTAREFPLPALVFMLRTLRDKDLMLCILDDANRDRSRHVRYSAFIVT